MRTAIYINGRQLDIADDTSISLTYRSAAFTSVDKLKNSYTNTVKIPRTANNEAAFGAVVFPSSQSDNPYVYHAASIELNGMMVVPSAVAYITQVTDNSISLCLLWDSVVKLSAMIADKRKLNELPYDKGKDVLTWNKTYAAAYDIFDMGLQAEDPYTAQHPSVSVRSVLQRICDAYALPMPPDEDISDMEAWKLPLPTRIDPIITDGEELFENNVTTWYGSSCMMLMNPSATSSNGVWKTSYPIWLGRVGIASGTKPDTELPDVDIPVVYPMYPYFELIGKPTIGEEEIIPPFNPDSPIPDHSEEYPANPTDLPPEWVSRELRGIVGNAGNTNYLQYLVPHKPNLKFVCSGEMRVPLLANSPASLSFIMANVKLQLVLLSRPLNAQADYSEDVLLTIDAYAATEKYITFLFDSAESSAIPYPLLGTITDIYNKADVRLQWRIYYEDTQNGRVRLDYGKTFGSSSITGTALYLSASQELLRLDSTYFIVPNYPAIGCVDFLKALGQMSGRFLTVESRLVGGKYKTVTRFRAYSDFEQRKSEALDWSDYVVRVLGSVTDMSFKVGEWCQRNTFKYKDGEAFNAHDGVDVFIDNKSLAAEQIAVELPFTAAVSRDDKQTIYVPLYKYSEENGIAEYDGKGDKAYIGELNNGRIVNSLRWNKLIKNYEAMLKPLRKAKVVREQMRIPFVALQSLDLYKPIYLRQYGSFFAIIEIKTRNNGLSDVELLKI